MKNNRGKSALPQETFKIFSIKLKNLWLINEGNCLTMAQLGVVQYSQRLYTLWKYFFFFSFIFLSFLRVHEMMWSVAALQDILISIESPIFSSFPEIMLDSFYIFLLCLLQENLSLTLHIGMK